MALPGPGLGWVSQYVCNPRCAGELSPCVARVYVFVFPIVTSKEGILDKI